MAQFARAPQAPIWLGLPVSREQQSLGILRTNCLTQVFQ